MSYRFIVGIAAVEKHQIAGNCIFKTDEFALQGNDAAGIGQRLTEIGKHELYKTTAVKASGHPAAIAVRFLKVLFCKGNQRVAGSSVVADAAADRKQSILPGSELHACKDRKQQGRKKDA